MVYVTRDSSLLNFNTIFSHLKVGAGMRVGDLGCGGHGLFALHAARLVGSRGVVYTVDILKTTLAEVAKKARLEGLANVKAIWSNLEIVGSTAIIPQSLDVALLVNVLFQTPDRASVLSEAKRLLKPGGQLLVVEWKPSAMPLGPALNRRVIERECLAIARAAGFTLTEPFDAGRYHYGLVFTK